MQNPFKMQKPSIFSHQKEGRASDILRRGRHQPVSLSVVVMRQTSTTEGALALPSTKIPSKCKNPLLLVTRDKERRWVSSDEVTVNQRPCLWW